MAKSYFNFRFQLAVPLVILLIGTPIFYFSNLDLSISSHWFTNTQYGTWEMQNHPFWSFVYTYGVLVPVLALLWGIVGLLRSILSGRPIDRLRSFCVILCFILGPGLLVHGLFKQHYPRPRPYDIQQFKGKSEFKKILVMGEAGESFPSGHASAGFSLTIFFYLYYLKNRKKAWGLLFIATVISGLLAVGRIVQGGHFSSDILWAFGLMQMVNVIVFFKILKIPEKEKREEYWKQKKPSPGLKTQILVNFSSIGLVLFVAILFLINRPLTYYHTEHKALSTIPNEITLRGELNNEKIMLHPTDQNEISIDYLVLSHGFPYTTFEFNMKLEEGEHTIVNLETLTHGITREYRGRIKIFFPKSAKLIDELGLPPEKIIWEK